jgi:UrcA family protein
MDIHTHLGLHRCRRPLAAASLAVLAVTAWAGSADPGTQRSEKISVKDLDLTTADGLDAARARVDQAARRLCFAVSHPDDRSRHSNYLKCVDDSVATALLQLGASAGTRVAERSVGQRNVQ